jgi:hypothetical protein
MATDSAVQEAPLRRRSRDGTPTTKPPLLTLTMCAQAASPARHEKFDVPKLSRSQNLKLSKLALQNVQRVLDLALSVDGMHEHLENTTFLHPREGGRWFNDQAQLQKISQNQLSILIQKT